MTKLRELCRLLSATLHISGVERWAEQLVRRELLPGLDHEANAFDAALLLAAVVAAPRPADAPRANAWKTKGCCPINRLTMRSTI